MGLGWPDSGGRSPAYVVIGDSGRDRGVLGGIHFSFVHIASCAMVGGMRPASTWIAFPSRIVEGGHPGRAARLKIRSACAAAGSQTGAMSAR